MSAAIAAAATDDGIENPDTWSKESSGGQMSTESITWARIL